MNLLSVGLIFVGKNVNDILFFNSKLLNIHILDLTGIDQVFNHVLHLMTILLLDFIQCSRINTTSSTISYTKPPIFFLRVQTSPFH